MEEREESGREGNEGGREEVKVCVGGRGDVEEANRRISAKCLPRRNTQRVVNLLRRGVSKTGQRLTWLAVILLRPPQLAVAKQPRHLAPPGQSSTQPR